MISEEKIKDRIISILSDRKIYCVSFEHDFIVVRTNSTVITFFEGYKIQENGKIIEYLSKEFVYNTYKFVGASVEKIDVKSGALYIYLNDGKTVIVCEFGVTEHGDAFSMTNVDTKESIFI